MDSSRQQNQKTIGEEINIATQNEISIGQLAEELIRQIKPNAKIVCDEKRLRPEKVRLTDFQDLMRD